jgi:hypothetical protein
VKINLILLLMNIRHIVFFLKLLFVITLFIVPFGSVLSTVYLIHDKRFHKEIWFILKKHLNINKYINIKNKVAKWMNLKKNSLKYSMKKIF